MNPQVPQISMFSSLQPSLLSSSLSSLLLSPPDLHLVSSEGYSLASHSLLLTLYSSSLPSLLSFLPPSPTHSLSLPFPLLPPLPPNQRKLPRHLQLQSS